MNRRRLLHRFVLVGALGLAGLEMARAQENPAIGHATRVLDLLDAGKYEEVAAEFNAKMAAAMPASRLRDVWMTLRQ